MILDSFCFGFLLFWSVLTLESFDFGPLGHWLVVIWSVESSYSRDFMSFYFNELWWLQVFLTLSDAILAS